MAKRSAISVNVVIVSSLTASKPEIMTGRLAALDQSAACSKIFGAGITGAEGARANGAMAETCATATAIGRSM